MTEQKPERKKKGYVTISRKDLEALRNKLAELSFVTREEVAEIDRWLA